MLVRTTNASLLGLLVLLTCTGLYGLVWPQPGWVFEVHRVAGWAFLALLPWKTAISLRSLRRGLRPNVDRGLVTLVSLLLAAATLATVGLALAWTFGPAMVTVWAGFTALNLHWLLGLLLVPPLALHAWRRWPRPRRQDLVSRRAALRALAASAAGLAGWQVAGLLAPVPKAASGSVERDSFRGNAFPVTTNPGDGRIRLDPASWRLQVGGAVARPFALTYPDLLSLPAEERQATLDCTVGWFSTQVWRGVPLMDLVRAAHPLPGAGLVQLVAASGYSKTFTFREAAEILLATHVGGEPLSHAHGAPLRAVVPSRRGWFWVKWLVTLRVLRSPTDP